MVTEQVTERLGGGSGRPVAPGDVVLDRYRIIDWIGSGAYGVVMRAVDIAHGSVFAIKFRYNDYELSRKDEQRFMREIQAVASLRSEHAARLFDYGALPDGTPFMVLEYLDGRDLGKTLAKQNKLATAVAVDYVLQACDALAEAHALGIIHRDIKPANLMLTRRADGSELIKVLDFGCAKAPGTELTTTGSIVGTPAYMSPEQMSMARNADARCDIWSLGALLYRLVEGRPPFGAKHFMDLATQVASGQPEPMMTAPQLAPVVDRCLRKDPRERYPTISELMTALAPFAARPVALPVAPRRRRWWSSQAVRVGLAAVVVGVTGGIITVLREPAEDADAMPQSPDPTSAPAPVEARAPAVAPAPPASAPADPPPQAASEPEVPAPEQAPAMAREPSATVATPPRRAHPAHKKRPTARHPATSRSAPDQPDDTVPCDPTASPGGC